MAVLSNAFFTVGHGRLAQFGCSMPDASAFWEAEGPVLIVEADDIEHAKAMLAAIEKVDRPAKRKRRAKTASGPAADPETPSGDATGAGRVEPDDPPCPSHADGRHVRTGGAACLCEPAKPDPVPATIGKTRPHRVRDGEPGSAA